MTVYEAIGKFPEQFSYEPEIKNALGHNFNHFAVIGMGGSHLAADLVKAYRPEITLSIRSDYGLPQISEKTLIIASSYSGNTEEVLDAASRAVEKKLPIGIIASGGKLLAYAQKNNLMYIKLPGQIQPRLAIGFSFLAFLGMMGQHDVLREAKTLSQSLDAKKYEADGKALAVKLQGMIPLVYASNRMAPLALNWKIRFNETSKTPAFHNVFPELNHNEMAGFDLGDVPGKFHFLFLRDDEDDPRIHKRMAVLEEMYQERGFTVSIITLEGKTVLEKIFSSIMLADWTTYHLAKNLGRNLDGEPMVEDFKKRIAQTHDFGI